MNRVCELLGVRHPIVQGGMAHLATGSLAGAVSEAGGFGIIGSGGQTKEWVIAQIAKARAITQKPFGVNIAVLYPNAAEIVDVVIGEKVPVVTTGGGNPTRFFPALKRAGIKIIPVVPNVTIAKKMEGAGADAIIAEGAESGGHVGKTTTMALIPAVRDAISIPLIAAGGIADWRGLVAAFALGAEGVQMGTRFICTDECVAHRNYKDRIMSCKDDETIVTGTTIGHPLRVIENTFSREFLRLESEGVDPAELSRRGVGRYLRAARDGDVDNGSVIAGQASHLVRREIPVRRLIEDLVAGARVWMATVASELERALDVEQAGA